MEQKRTFVTVSMILGITSSALIIIGMMLPVLDISCFYDKADFQYNLFKVCKNIGFISSMWKAIPIGFIIAAVFMFILSFVRIPIFKILPCVLAIAMIVLMLADVSHVVDWIKGFLEKYTRFTNDKVSVDIVGVIKSLMIGVYVIVAGIIIGIVSCFINPKDLRKK